MSKDGATNQDTVSAYASSKAWLFSTTRAQFNLNWEKEIPQAHHNLTFPPHLRLHKWNDTREIFKTISNRTPNDPCHPKEPEPCPYREGFMSCHLVIYCCLLAAERLKMTTKNGLEIESNLYTSMLGAKAINKTIHFLQTRGLGYRIRRGSLQVRGEVQRIHEKAKGILQT
jgi:hypothetical protein